MHVIGVKSNEPSNASEHRKKCIRISESERRQIILKKDMEISKRNEESWWRTKDERPQGGYFWREMNQSFAMHVTGRIGCPCTNEELTIFVTASHRNRKKR